MDNPNHAIETLDRLHALGIRLSVDDFGTGYSSLSYLKRMPVNEIKIDRSFVMGMTDHKDDETIVRSTIDLGHNMGLKVVAEGVESEQMMTRPRELQCDLAQGFHLSRPLLPAKLELWLAGWVEENNLRFVNSSAGHVHPFFSFDETSDASRCMDIHAASARTWACFDQTIARFEQSRTAVKGAPLEVIEENSRAAESRHTRDCRRWLA
jgi:hypothetical protein